MIIIRTKERGNPGHFICSKQCVFHRNTLITASNIMIVVSTVGNWKADGPYEPGVQIGSGQYYETCAFVAFATGDADVSSEIGEARTVNHCDDAADIEADDMHDARVKEIIDGIKSGINYYKYKHQENE